MKPISGSNQLGLDRRSNAAIPSGKTKFSLRKKTGLDASRTRSHRESGEVFFLDTLSHRMSDMEIYREPREARRCVAVNFARGSCKRPSTEPCSRIREASDRYIRSPSWPTAIAWNHRAWRSADGGIVDTLDTVDCRRRHWSCNLGGAAELRR